MDAHGRLLARFDRGAPRRPRANLRRESMNTDLKHELSRDDCHPKARTVLTDAFLWDYNDPCSPFGDESGLEIFEAFRDFRAESPRGNPITVLDEMLERWEIVNGHWDAVTAAEVHAI